MQFNLYKQIIPNKMKLRNNSIITYVYVHVTFIFSIRYD